MSTTGSAIDPSLLEKYTPQQIHYLQQINEAAARCQHDFYDVIGYLLIISGIITLVFCWHRLMNKTFCTFPDNLITIFGALCFVTTLGQSLTFLTEREIYSSDLSSMCVLQGIILVFSVVSMPLLWFSIVISMYQITVCQTPIQVLRKRAMYFYLGTFLIPVVLCVCLWGTENFGPLPSINSCFIKKEKVLLRFFGVFFIFPFLWVAGFYCIARMIIMLCGTGFSKSSNERSRLLSKTYIIQLSLFNLAFLYFMVLFWLFALNEIIAEYFPHQLQYVAATSYSYCAALTHADALIGVIISIIFGVTVFRCKSASQKARDLLKKSISTFSSSAKKKSARPAANTGAVSLTDTRWKHNNDGGHGHNHLSTGMLDSSSYLGRRSKLSTPSSMIQSSESHIADSSINMESAILATSYLVEDGDDDTALESDARVTNSNPTPVNVRFVRTTTPAGRYVHPRTENNHAVNGRRNDEGPGRQDERHHALL